MTPLPSLDENSNYQLVDFGDGEKLERFGKYLVRRPNLYARSRKTNFSIWDSADLIFDERQQKWQFGKAFCDENWVVKFGTSTFRLKPTPVGHLGIFPEQQSNWNWIRKNFTPPSGAPLKALNLFAYTGGTTMALASCGIEVVHVDGAANTVKWARNNASESGLDNASIRWITEDVMKFIRREIKRDNQYDILIADPPSFGRGPKKEQWRIDRDLPELFESLSILLPRPKAVVMSCHSEGYSCSRLASELRQSIDTRSGTLEKFTLTLNSTDGHNLDSGECVRWVSGS